MMVAPATVAATSTMRLPARALVCLSTWTMRVVGLITVALMVIETVVLLAGVISRYVLHNPLIWSDELASSLFIWMAMFGAVLALDRGEHMRMSALVNKLPQAWRGFCETQSALVVCLFVVMIIAPAMQHSHEQMWITTPALGIPDGLRAAALPVGAVLMLLAAPPLGVGFYAACAISKVSSDHVIRRVWGYLAALILALIIVACFPWISIGFL
ncbi:TRAP transporter small permease [Pseudomonas tolaasii]